MDKLQVLHEFASQNQSSSRIFKAIADPPTTSLQRLKVNMLLLFPWSDKWDMDRFSVFVLKAVLFNCLYTIFHVPN